MSEIGVWGIKLNGEYKTTFVHWGGTPAMLGETLKGILVKIWGESKGDPDAFREELTSIFNRIKLVKMDDIPTEEEKVAYGRFQRTPEREERLGGGSYYDLLYGLQGQPELYYTDDSIELMVQNPGHTDYIYLIDLDAEVVQISSRFWSKTVIPFGFIFCETVLDPFLFA